MPRRIRVATALAALAVASAHLSPAIAAQSLVTDEVIVTAPRMSAPLSVITDPKAARQPIPAHDGADYLKGIPGFSVIRKGGTDGDPVFRGMAGSRLNMLLDGELILGGCGMRMDPPTAYVFPESYDRITVIKGPQTVVHGPGASAATVLFEREHKRLGRPDWHFDGSVTLGSFGRRDLVADFTGGSADLYARAIGTDSRSDDYKDGADRTVHSAYRRWSANAVVGWTPDDDTRAELSAARSDGEAAYADRSMDGVKFARENLGLKLERRNISPLVEKLDLRLYRNYIDHVMDNYSLRTFVPSMMMPNPSASNPDRDTIGGRAAAELALAPSRRLTLGLDLQNNIHTVRTTMNQIAMPYESMPRVEDANFRNFGVFAELHDDLSDETRLIAGLRNDWSQAQDKRENVNLGMMTTAANPSAGQTRKDSLTGGFVRYERDLTPLSSTVYAGIGHSARMPDYWELISKESETTLSAFNTRPENTTQLDAGLLHAHGRWTGSLSAFYNQIDDFILIQSNFVKPAGMMGTRTTTVTRNIDAITWGAEAGLAYKLADAWTTDVALSYVRGDNVTDDLPLAQLPPLEARFGLAYDDRTRVFGALLRLVTAQDRIAIDQGNIVGQDIGPTAGFGVLSLNGGWRPARGVLLAAGVDNVFDRTYAEHISRSGALVAGFDQTTRVNEPGRMLWMKASISLD